MPGPAIPLRVIDRPNSQAMRQDCVFDSQRIPVDLTLPVQLSSTGRPSTQARSRKDYNERVQQPGPQTQIQIQIMKKLKEINASRPNTCMMPDHRMISEPNICSQPASGNGSQEGSVNESQPSLSPTKQW